MKLNLQRDRLSLQGSVITSERNLRIRVTAIVIREDESFRDKCRSLREFIGLSLDEIKIPRKTIWRIENTDDLIRVDTAIKYLKALGLKRVTFTSTGRKAYMSSFDTLGRNLERMRLVKGMSKSGLRGVSIGVVTSIEHGRGYVKHYPTYAKALGIGELTIIL